MFRPPNHPGLRAALTFTCALLLLVGNLAGALHLATIRHAVCETHGELVHGEGGHAHQSTGEPATQADPSLRPSGNRYEDSHEHCCTLLSHRERLLMLQSPMSIARSVLESPAATPQARPRAEAKRSRILLAPKNSPPAESFRACAEDLQQA